MRAPDIGLTRRLVADVAAGRERLVAGAGQHDDADFGIVSRHLHRFRQFLVGLRPNRVAHLRTVDGDGGDAAVGLVKHVFEHG